MNLNDKIDRLRAHLLRNPNDVAHLRILIAPGDLPATESRQVDTDYHQWLVFLLPAVAGTVGEENRWRKGVQSHPCDR